MKMNISVTVTMSDEQLRSWANEYGLAIVEAEADARNMIGDLVEEAVKRVPHVRDFVTVTDYQVQ